MSVDQQSIVARWNEVLLESIRSGIAKPTETTHQLYQTHAAIYDAWAAYDSSAYGQYTIIERPMQEHNDSYKAEAVSHAAYGMLRELFPERQQEFDAFMDELGYDRSNQSLDLNTAAGVGNAAARGVIEARADDGSNAENGYVDTLGFQPFNSADPNSAKAPGGSAFDPNRWQPLRVPNGTAVDENGNPVASDDPSTYDDQTGLTPHWGGVQPFALDDIASVRPDAPPELGDFGVYVDALGNVTTGDQAYRDQFGEVLEISGDLTPRQKLIAEYLGGWPAHRIASRPLEPDCAGYRTARRPRYR